MLTTFVTATNARATQGPQPCVARLARRRVGVLIAAAVLLLGRSAAAQHASAEDVNAANNPLTPKITINFHDQWAPELYDVGEGSNAFLFRGVVPHKLGGIAQLFRYTLPVVTAPDATGGSRCPRHGSTPRRSRRAAELLGEPPHLAGGKKLASASGNGMAGNNAMKK